VLAAAGSRLSAVLCFRASRSAFAGTGLALLTGLTLTLVRAGGTFRRVAPFLGAHRRITGLLATHTLSALGLHMIMFAGRRHLLAGARTVGSGYHQNGDQSKYHKNRTCSHVNIPYHIQS
jgi:hypothetical protein